LDFYPNIVLVSLTVVLGLFFIFASPGRLIPSRMLSYLLGLFCLASVFIIRPGFLAPGEVQLTYAVLITLTTGSLLLLFLFRAIQWLWRRVLSVFRHSLILPDYLREINRAIRLMTVRHIGALIVIRRKDKLKNYIASALRIDADVRAELLISIFELSSPLHDGALIIADGRILAAKAVLPLSQKPDLPMDLGTRHRSAIGISEQTDAVVIVVSEERGESSVVYKGTLVRANEPDELLKIASRALKGKWIRAN
jgi:uncharacterized protein (TIGR00159 family)